MKYTFLAFLFVSLSALSAPQLEATHLKFEYQELTGDFRKFECEHKKANVGLFEWDVSCNVNGKPHTYFVHLVLQFYPKTIHGNNAYELLYWITDMTNSKKPVHDSSTTWFHNSHPENFLKVLEISQGIEDDMAYLKLTIKRQD